MSEETHSQPGSLFRKQAVAHQTRSLDGEVLLSLTLSTRILIGLAVVVVAGAALFVATASYARKETVAGWVVPEAGLIRVSARQGGVIETLNVKEGDSVAASEAMASLRLSSDIASGNAGAAIAGHLTAQMEASRAEAEAQRMTLMAEQKQLTAHRTAMLRELEASRTRVTAMDERLHLADANAARVGEVADRGFASIKAVEEAQMAVTVAQQDAAEIRASVMGIERQIGDLDAQLAAIPLRIQAADAQARASQAALAQQETEYAAQNVYHAGATVAGRVVAVPVSRGQTVEPGAVIAVVTPEGSSLEAELYVPSRSAGFIQPGQNVQLMYQAFPYQKFGTARGTVSAVSRTVLAPSEVAIPGLEVQEPVFRVKVVLTEEVVRAYGQEIPVQPGMLLSASVEIDRRTLLEWLLDPIYAVGKLG